MSSIARFHAQIAGVALPVFALAAAGWYVNPERLKTWTVAAGAMAMIWLLIAALERTQKSDNQRRMLVGNVLFAGSMLALPMSIKLAQSFGYVLGEQGSRASGVAVGLLLVAVGNALPKTVVSLAASRCPPAEIQAVNRFGGWVMVIAGLAFVPAWILLPLDVARAVSIALIAATVVLVIARIWWAKRGSRLRGA